MNTRIFTPRRELGRTEFRASAIGIGDIADRAVPIEACVATVHRAMDAGLNLIDTAPGYENGYSEDIVGRALRGRREGMFVIDKIDHLDQPAGPQVDASLQRLGIDTVDAFVLHGLSSVEKWNEVTSAGGLMDGLGDCVKAGKLKFRGISSHNPDVLRMAIPSGLCDLVMFAIGPYVDGRYVSEILPLTKQHGVGTVCFKTFGAGKLLGDTSGYQQPLKQRPRGKVSSGGGEATATLPRMRVKDCLHYTLTLDPDVALLGMSFPNEQDAVFAAYRDFDGPLSETDMEAIRAQAVVAIADKGPCWWNPHP